MVSAAPALLGGMSCGAFMRRHWQRKPLVVRATGIESFVDRGTLFRLAARDDVESRLVVREAAQAAGMRSRAADAAHVWQLAHGPIAARARPPLSLGGWTLLVQGVDLHLDAAHELLAKFSFVSWARLDDVMVSFATDGGGVGPHTDEYDVFLVQLQGRRRWRVGPASGSNTQGVERKPRWQEGVPLKLLADFEPSHEWLLEPGDMLYVPPGWGHDGIGEGASCITASVGFRAPRAGELARELLARLADVDDDDDGERYRDPPGGAAADPARIAPQLAAFAQRHVRRAISDAQIALVLGEWLTEPKPNVWFKPTAPVQPSDPWLHHGLRLDRRSRMLFDDAAIYLNGESYLAQGRDAKLLRTLADARSLDARACAGFSAAARDTIDGWITAGWVMVARASAMQTPAQPLPRRSQRP